MSDDDSVDFKSVKRFCEHCGAPLTLVNSRDLERKHFCSRACSVKAHAAIPGSLVRRGFSRFGNRIKRIGRWFIGLFKRNSD